MAVVTAPRVVKPERVGKHRFGKTLAQTAGFFLGNSTNRMSEHFQLQLSTTSESVPVVSPTFTPQPDVTGGAPGAESFTKKRKASKSKIPPELRRTMSTPHIRDLAMGHTGGISPTDKRRNKLGYHRTSVACGHCRRRKIRCLLPTPEDPQGRCSNCIRLKKECNFYPVTEASQHERAGKKTALSGSASGSTPASPRPAGSSKSGSVEDMQGAVHFPAQSSPYQPTPLQSESYSLPQVNGVHYQQPQYGYTPGLHPAEGWTSGYSSEHSQHQAPHHGSISPFWSSAHTPATTSYQTSPSSSAAPTAPSPFESPTFNYHHNHQGQTWAQPRSLSFSHFEHGQLPQPQYQYHEPQGQQSHQLPHLPFPPSLPSNTHPPAATTTTTTTHEQPTTLPATTHPMPNYTYQPQHWQSYSQPQSLPSMQERPPPEFHTSQWYQEPTHHAPRSQEEQVHYGNPGVYYPHGSHAG